MDTAVMVRVRQSVLMLAITALLSGCMGSQTGKGLNAFDSKSFWESNYGDPISSHSFWYSGYSDEEIEKAEKGSGGGKDIWGRKMSGGAGGGSGSGGGSGGGMWSGGVGPTDSGSSDSGSSN